MGEGCDAGPLENAFGTAGGVVLALCLVPQIYQNMKTKSTDDLSYGWLGMYTLGLVFTFVYMVMIGALVGWIGVAVEVSLALFTLYLKVYYENFYHRKRNHNNDAEKGGEKSSPCGDSPRESVKAADDKSPASLLATTAIPVVSPQDKTFSVRLPEDYHSNVTHVLEKTETCVGNHLNSLGKPALFSSIWSSLENGATGGRKEGVVITHTHNGTCITEFSWDTNSVKVSLTGQLGQDSAFIDWLVSGLREAVLGESGSHSAAC
eukprot:comp17900_c1_seq1/m.18148 comp17900_c1_seq1/g.18148  ORF comp17900_c1_seq1/g.18148 comp17900_c1_seq1/m.18148 type:complete len:263 (-) comp17900_c1_seq1:78-866(-)